MNAINYQEYADIAYTRCTALAQFTETPGQMTRTYLSDAMKLTHKEIEQWAKASNLPCKVDHAGNIIVSKKSKNSDAKTFLIGSHLDTVPDGGIYDGILGFITGLSLLELSKDQDYGFNIDVIGFADEEGVRYRSPYLGSSAITGKFDLALLQKKDNQGITIAEALSNFGLDANLITTAAYKKEQVIAYAEIHIEQGPVLEEQNLSLGIVTGIAGQSRIKGSIAGLAAHAGTTPMHLRKDALTGFAEIILFIEDYAKKESKLFATVGQCQAQPGATNVIPGHVDFSIDIRHIDDQVRVTAVKTILDFIDQVCKKRRLTLAINQHEEQKAVPCDQELMAKLNLATQKSNLKANPLVSGAGHDAAMMAELSPICMLFIRSPNGLSHNPNESVYKEDIGDALKLMHQFLMTL